MRDVSYFHLRLRHRKPPTIGPFENTQGGLQRTTHWMWETRVGQHPVLDPGHSQESEDRISRWLFQFLALLINSFFLLLFCGGVMASWLVRSSPDRAGQVRVLAGDVVLCSWARHFALTVPSPGTQVSKWVPTKLMLWVLASHPGGS